MQSTDHQCAKCNKTFAMLAVVGGDHTPPQIDDILLCSQCGTPNVVTLEGTRLMTEIEFAGLKEDELKDLKFAQRGLIQGRNGR
jgi:translation elongation factor EF-Tu-like GTPase